MVHVSLDDARQDVITMHTDDIIKAVGGMSTFQVVLILLVFSPRALIAWGMLIMSFAGSSPDWWCVPGVPSTFDISQINGTYFTNETLKLCPSADTGHCSFVYSLDKKTIISEWDLVCENSKTAASVTSIQMGGVLTGAFLGGQSADTIGRKLTLYLSVLLSGGFNLVAAFSVSWQMFAVLRFFIGMTIGSILVVTYPYAMEFLSPYWRSVCSVFSFWTVGVCAMALSSWLRPNWSHQHMILGALHIPVLFGWFIVPESLRWLAVKGRLDEAERVVDQMCRYNKREKPDNARMILEKVAQEEKEQRESGKKYTYIDVYRPWSLCWKSIVIQLVWAGLSFVFYGISFGADKLSGNLYFNIFLLSIVDLPAAVATFFMNNKIGRRWTGFTFFSVAFTAALGVVITTKLASEDEQGSIITGLVIVAKVGAGAAWLAFGILSTEIYPTVIRNLGYGAANTAARVGGIIAPYIFSIGDGDITIPLVIVGVVMAACALVTMLLPETNGTPLEDSAGTSVTSVVDEKEPKDGLDVAHTKL